MAPGVMFVAACACVVLVVSCGGDGGDGTGPGPGDYGAWTSIPAAGAPNLSGTVAFWTGTKLLLWDGDDGATYDPGDGSWAAINNTDADAPTGLYDYSAVWTGSKMIVWGGSDGSTYVNTGSAYDPVGDSWTAINPTGAPALGRIYHSAVWTGSTMIVWGGRYHNGSSWVGLDDGGIYDPAGGGSWTAVGASGAPSARTKHAAVWTGSEMLVWGGVESSGPCNTGARYDPSSGGSWTTMQSSGAPTVRSSFTGLWTGTELVIWGGFFFDGPTWHLEATGGRYDPAADSWQSTNTTGAPVARMNHTAVWSGSTMIVWGGYDALDVATPNTTGDTNTGGVYDPAADSWTATSLSGAPIERVGHAAVWTGANMIVWGGMDFDVITSVGLKDGGIYTP
jgi:hypothetical protein